ncbi:MAG: cell division protein FtsZ [Candidatus Cloacimonetes bacterium]|nr:cell division protein FtsZ [Candidatus Cloacimonadota bacterium]
MLEYAEEITQTHSIIKIIGVGGGGGNAVNSMIRKGIDGVEFIVVNTNEKDLENSLAQVKIQLGPKATKGLGCGAHPELGREAAEESEEEIRSALAGAEMLFIAAGMGGGTGTGAAPVVGRIAKEMGILTMAIVTRPFLFEGKIRGQNAEYGLRELKTNSDTLVAIPNEKLKEIYSDLAIFEAFEKADSVLANAAKAVSDMINISGYISVDLADVKTVMANMGYTLMGTAVCEGEGRAANAAQQAIANPLLSDISLDGCKAILINVTAGYDMKTSEFDTISQVITNETGTDANIIIGLVIDEKMTEKISVTIIATGLMTENDEQPEMPDFQQKSGEEKNQQLDIVFEGTRHRQMQLERDWSINDEKGVEKITESERAEVPAFIRKFSN